VINVCRINALSWLASVALVAVNGIDGSVTEDVALGTSQ
jgi:hypothetical protein